MSKNHLKHLAKMKIIFLLFIIVCLTFIGCSEKIEKKEAAPTKPTAAVAKSSCSTLDALPRDIAKVTDVNYDGKIKLLGVTAEKVSDNQLRMSYYWQQLKELDDHKDVFVHFTDKENKIVFQNDHSFCKNIPFEQLKGKYVKEDYLLNVTNVTGQEFSLKIGIYSMKSRSRLKIEAAGGVSTDNKNTRAVVEKIKF